MRELTDLKPPSSKEFSWKFLKIFLLSFLSKSLNIIPQLLNKAIHMIFSRLQV